MPHVTAHTALIALIAQPTTPDAREVFAAVDAMATWLDEHHGAGRAEIASRLLKVAEELGEAITAWIGATGQNPRKGHTHTEADVAAELADTAFAALVAIASLPADPATALARAAAAVRGRIPANTVPLA